MYKGGYSLKGAGVRRDVKVTVEGGAGLVQSFLRVVAAEVFSQGLSETEFGNGLLV